MDSVLETTFPTTSAMAMICGESEVILASLRMEETRFWIFWTRRAV